MSVQQKYCMMFKVLMDLKVIQVHASHFLWKEYAVSNLISSSELKKALVGEASSK